MTPIRTLALALAATTMVGCASFKPGDKTAEAELKKFATVQGKSSLYVCREKAAFVAAGVSSNVLVNKQDVGTVKPNTFVHAIVEPGKHEVQLKNDGMMSVTAPTISIETKPNELAFLWVGVTGGGWGAYTIDHFRNATEGMGCVTDATYSVKAM
ncbi:MAG: hypothetical protein O9312_14275 [Hylemonella sp.]|nr:hypothetical protein [Hylemonella sp.]